MPSPGPFPKPTGLVQCFVSARIATRKIRWSVRATRGRPVAGMRGPLPINEVSCREPALLAGNWQWLFVLSPASAPANGPRPATDATSPPWPGPNRPREQPRRA
jgi:hypothetical protein